MVWIVMIEEIAKRIENMEDEIMEEDMDDMKRTAYLDVLEWVRYMVYDVALEKAEKK